ncbi:porin family protein [Paracoccus sp. pheM1]|uniref:outer membrane protein n=1 Tax=Paracoccus sp. pheM1 TaxID=2831675 RepID=UPI001BDB86CC|nr:porin family protein [Paracoccus sp. pheM1]MBT0778531.1 outer membrane beta-barrel protein [Paracoccus sp. pheM1]
MKLKAAFYAAAASLAASLVAGASFAGGYVPPVVEQPVAVAQTRADVDWTGFYAGLQYGQGNLDASVPGVTVDAGDFDALGLHAGYLRDFGQFVLGGELDYNNVEHDDFDGSADLWRLRARAGYDMGKFQPYVTLGAARLSGEDAKETGLTYGIGADFLLTDNFSAGLEYSHADFSDVDGTNIDLDADMVQIRASYRF